MTARPFIPVDQSSAAPSSRLLLALHDLNKYAAHPDFGVPQHMIEDAQHQLAVPFEKDPRNLVVLLIQDNADIYNKLLHNKFCQAMAKAPADDKPVADGFKWYMIQDFLYCAKLMLYDTERASKASDIATFKQLTQKIKNDTDYAVSLLETCTNATKLNIPEAVVLNAPRELATDDYTSFSVEMADKFDWITSLVAMVPCIQSYYQIAKILEKESIHKDTPWYKLWVEENVKYEKSTQKQIQFFIANYDVWKAADYKKLCYVFTKACQHEIDLWAVGEHPGKVN